MVSAIDTHILRDALAGAAFEYQKIRAQAKQQPCDRR